MLLRELVASAVVASLACGACGDDDPPPGDVGRDSPIDGPRDTAADTPDDTPADTPDDTPTDGTADAGDPQWVRLPGLPEDSCVPTL